MTSWPHRRAASSSVSSNPTTADPPQPIESSSTSRRLSASSTKHNLQQTLILGALGMNSNSPNYVSSSSSSPVSGGILVQSMTNGSTHTGALSVTSSAFEEDLNQVYSSSLDDYNVTDPIGYGASAVVYAATYRATGKKLAIKIIDLDAFERHQIEELRRETQVMALCRHPNVLRVISSFVNEEKLYLVTPYLAGGSCLDIMKTAFPAGFEETAIATILKQTLQGLEYMHRHRHIHRDIKAGNLLIDSDGTVQLADFGVSSSLMETGERKSRRKTFVGTPCWMAPEVMEQSGYDYKADLWSFGITCIELATGHAPYAKYPPLKVLMLVLNNDPPTLDRERTKHKYTKTFKEMIDSCLQKDAKKRPSAEKLLLHSFFKQAKKKQWLVGAVLSGLPPLEQRLFKRKEQKQSSYRKPISWDFSDGNCPVSTEDDMLINQAASTSAPDITRDVEDGELGKGMVKFSEPIKEPRRGTAAAIAAELSSSPPAFEEVPSVRRSVQKKGRFVLDEGEDDDMTTPTPSTKQTVDFSLIETLERSQMASTSAHIEMAASDISASSSMNLANSGLLPSEKTGEIKKKGRFIMGEEDHQPLPTGTDMLTVMSMNFEEENELLSETGNIRKLSSNLPESQLETQSNSQPTQGRRGRFEFSAEEDAHLMDEFSDFRRTSDPQPSQYGTTNQISAQHGGGIMQQQIEMLIKQNEAQNQMLMELCGHLSTTGTRKSSIVNISEVFQTMNMLERQVHQLAQDNTLLRTENEQLRRQLEFQSQRNRVYVDNSDIHPETP